MRRLFSRLQHELEHGDDVMLVTVIADQGSAPRGAGAAMLVGANGRIIGTVGGGAVEYRSEAMALELLKEKRSSVHDFTLRPNPREDLGMQCGGDVSILFTYISGDDLRWDLLSGAVCDRIESREPGWLILPLNGGVPSLYGPDGLLAGEPLSEDLLPSLTGPKNVVMQGYYASPLPAFGRVLIFGGGHIAQALVPLLAPVDFRCIVLDDRPEYSRPELFPGADDAILCDYSDLAEYVTVTGEDYVVVMTNGHANDLTVEEQILRGSYAYLGVVGSRRKIAHVNEILTQRGISPEKLASVHTPIGIPIRAVTPAEIAVSILGELILCRAEIREGVEAPKRDCPM